MIVQVFRMMIRSTKNEIEIIYPIQIYQIIDVFFLRNRIKIICFVTKSAKEPTVAHGGAEELSKKCVIFIGWLSLNKMNWI